MFIDLFSGGSSFLIVQQVEQSLPPPRRNKRARKGRAGPGCMWRSSTTGVLRLLDAKISQFCDAPHFRLHRFIILQWKSQAPPPLPCLPPSSLTLAVLQVPYYSRPRPPHFIPQAPYLQVLHLSLPLPVEVKVLVYRNCSRKSLILKLEIGEDRGRIGLSVSNVLACPMCW
jgi:hypothetical protein